MSEDERYLRLIVREQSLVKAVCLAKKIIDAGAYAEDSDYDELHKILKELDLCQK